MNGKCDECNRPSVGKVEGGHNQDREFEYCEEHMPPLEEDNK